jgi:hypothetical protein
MRGFIGRGISSNRMAPPPVPPLQPGYPQRSSPTSSGIQHQQQHQPHQQQYQPEYPTLPVGSMDEWDDGQSSSRLSVAHQQQQMAGYPTQQYQSPAPAHTNATISQPPQPSYGYSSTSAAPSYSQHAHPAYTPMGNPSMYAARIPTAPSYGGNAQGQGQYYYSGAAAYSHPTQAYRQPPYTSPTHATGMYQVHTPAGSSDSGSVSIARPIPPMMPGFIPPSAIAPLNMRPPPLSPGSKGVAAGSSAAASAVGSQAPHRGGGSGYPMGMELTAPLRMDPVTSVSGESHFEYEPFEFLPGLPTLATPAGIFPLDDDSSSHVHPHLDLTASSETPHAGAAPGCSNASIGGASMTTQPTSLPQHIGPSRSDRRQASKPYQRPTPATRKARRIAYEGNLDQLQQRCRGQGADEGAIGLLGKVFANAVSLEALIRQLTDAEADTKEFGIETGRIYNVFLETTDEEGVVSHYACRLCHTEQIWKHRKDVLRHLRRDHFGFADVCKRWYVFGGSLMS